MNTGEVCRRNIATVGKDASVLRAAAIMRQHHVRDLVVIERRYGGWAPAGIITDHDIAIEVVGQGLDPRHVTVDTAMSSRLPVMGSGDSKGKSAGSIALDEMLMLLVTELNRVGQPIRQNQLTQPTQLTRLSTARATATKGVLDPPPSEEPCGRATPVLPH